MKKGFGMGEFEGSEIFASVVDGEIPNLKHSCIPSTYKAVGQQVKITMVVDVGYYQKQKVVLLNYQSD